MLLNPVLSTDSYMKICSLIDVADCPLIVRQPSVLHPAIKPQTEPLQYVSPSPWQNKITIQTDNVQHSTYNVTVRHVGATITAVEKQ